MTREEAKVIKSRALITKALELNAARAHWNAKDSMITLIDETIEILYMAKEELK